MTKLNGNASPKPRRNSKPNPADLTPSSSSNKQTKKSQVLSLLRREEGATLDEMVTATGWLPHTTRAALTGLRKAGHAIGKGKRGDVTCYSIEAVAQ